MTEHAQRLRARNAKMISAATETAERCLYGLITPGCRVIGFTKGQFSLLDLLKAIIMQTGPADLIISTWTAGIRDADNVNFLHERGTIRNLKLLIDRSFPNRKPEATAAVRRAFGNDSIVVTHTHAKIALISNDRFSLVVRSSMNLNRNPRFEHFDIDDDRAMFDFAIEHVNDLFASSPVGLATPLDAINAGFTASLGGGISDGYQLPTDGSEPYPPGFLESTDPEMFADALTPYPAGFLDAPW